MAGAARRPRCEIDDPPWALQPAELRVDVTTMASAHGIARPPVATLLHFAARQDVRVWPIERVRPDSG